ncbi:hypothetical protein M422DRAFT_784245, partial [Sphaerobolus stellatus SS14]
MNFKGMKTTSSTSENAKSPLMRSTPSSQSNAAVAAEQSASRSRTISTPVQAKPSKDNATRNHSQTTLSDTTRGRRASASTPFSITKSFPTISSSLSGFARRRRSTQQPSVRQHQTDSAGEVIEIGPTGSVHSRREEIDPSVNDDEERELLREAAAQALGLRSGASSSHLENSQEEEEDQLPTSIPNPTESKRSYPYSTPVYLGAAESPSSLISLPTTHSHLVPSIAVSAPAAPMPDGLPPFPAPFAALASYTQAKSLVLKYSPPPTFLAISFNRRAKQWKLRYIIFTCPPPNKRPPSGNARPHADFLQGAGVYDPLFGRHSHLHVFKSASPDPGELELDRLEIDEDSIIYISESEIAGKKDVLRVGGRTAIPREGTGERVLEEMGRSIWQVRFTDLHETQQWFSCVRSSVLQQRAEHAAMNYPNWNGNGSHSLPPLNTRVDMDLILSTQGSSGTSTPSHLVHNQYAKAASPTPTQSEFRLPLPSSSRSLSPAPLIPSPNPRYAEHVGAAPSRGSTTSSRGRTYPPPAALNITLPTFKNLFRSPPSPRQEQ